MSPIGEFLRTETSMLKKGKKKVEAWLGVDKFLIDKNNSASVLRRRVVRE